MDLQKKANSIRKRILSVAYENKAGHIGPSFSSADILTSLYFDNVLSYDSGNASAMDRDRFILSKGHGALLLYSTLIESGLMEESYIADYCSGHTEIGMHPTINKAVGIEATTGSLGHGFSFAAGIAKAAKIKKMKSKVYALAGDGECQEGSIWEALMFAAHHKLDNLTFIIDHNKLQGTDYVENVMSLGDLRAKAEAFGCFALEVDGHNFAGLKAAFDTISVNRPKVIVANTIKGKGVSFMENRAEYHSKIPDASEIEQAFEELSNKVRCQI